jgi:ribonucleoside-triphosphate reductase
LEHERGAEEGLSVPYRLRGVKVLKAVSSAIRLQILNLLFEKGPLSYTDMMGSLKMNPSRDAGRFAYHLRFLLKVDLIEVDVEAKKYCLTDLGKMVIEVADRVEKKALKPKSVLVRTSHSTLEEFDANKIASSLVKEAKMPVELAQKVAKETEKRLLKSKTKYLTAPLVRETVNGILIEKGFEEYRHKLTRLGLPVYDISALLDTRSKSSHASTLVREKAGQRVLKEYTLLSVFPRDISDAFLSGALHINDLGSWILRPSEVIHDLRVFLRNGLSMEEINPFQASYPPPRDFEAALSIVFNVLLHSVAEVGEAQTLGYFNVFLAPFAKSADRSRIKEALRLFVLATNQHVDVSLGVELAVPDFVGNKPAFGLLGREVGKYSDFAQETQLLARLLIEVLVEESQTKPLFEPKVIFKVCSKALECDTTKELFFKAHELSGKVAVYFANTLGDRQERSVFSGSGFRVESGSKGDWEIETLRVGRLGSVTVNVPQAAYESAKDRSRFLEVLKSRLELAVRALEIKYRSLRQHSKGLLSFLMQDVNGDNYLRLEHSSSIINFVGLREAVEVLSGGNAGQSDGDLGLGEEIAKTVLSFTQKSGRKLRNRLFASVLPDPEASERLARLDIERYGVGKVRFSGAREKPFYSTVGNMSIEGLGASAESRRPRQGLFGPATGGNLTVIELGTDEHAANELASVTKRVFADDKLELITYGRTLMYCVNCKKSWLGALSKCPSCGTTGSLLTFDRFSSV